MVEAIKISHSEVETSLKKSCHLERGLVGRCSLVDSLIPSKEGFLRLRKRMLADGEAVERDACDPSKVDDDDAMLTRNDALPQSLGVSFNIQTLPPVGLNGQIGISNLSPPGIH